MYQTFFVKVRFKLLKYDLYKGIIVVTKFSNQSHTHNLYRWPLQHAIASYSTAVLENILPLVTLVTSNNYVPVNDTPTTPPPCYRGELTGNWFSPEGMGYWYSSLLYRVQIPYVSPIVMLGPIGVLTLGSAPGVGFSSQHLVKSPLFPHPTRGWGGWGLLSLIGALYSWLCVWVVWLGY